MLFQMQVVPGHRNDILWQFDKPGVYGVKCMPHYAMGMVALVVVGKFDNAPAVAIGVVVAPQGRLARALRFTIANGKITEIEVIGNPARLGELEVQDAVAAVVDVHRHVGGSGRRFNRHQI